MKWKKSRQGIAYVLLLLAAMIVLFYWYTTQNSKRMVERNKNYAADSARLTAVKIDEELTNALNRISTYAYFIGKSLSEPAITAEMLKEMEEKALFDALMFTNVEGQDLASDGRTADVSGRDFYREGMKGAAGTAIIFDPYILDETMEIGRAHV